MFILFLCAILWNIIDCSVTPPTTFRAWNEDVVKWRWKSTKSPFTFDNDFDGTASQNIVIALVIITIGLFLLAILLICRCYNGMCCDNDESISVSSPTLHPPPRRAMTPPLARTPQTFRDTGTVNSYLQDRFPIGTVQDRSSPASTGALPTNNILRVQLFSNGITDGNNSVQNRNADKPPGYADVISNDEMTNHFLIVAPDSPPPPYDDKKY